MHMTMRWYEKNVDDQAVLRNVQQFYAIIETDVLPYQKQLLPNENVCRSVDDVDEDHVKYAVHAHNLLIMKCWEVTHAVIDAVYRHNHIHATLSARSFLEYLAMLTYLLKKVRQYREDGDGMKYTAAIKKLLAGTRLDNIREYANRNLTGTSGVSAEWGDAMVQSTGAYTYLSNHAVDIEKEYIEKLMPQYADDIVFRFVMQYCPSSSTQTCCP